MLGSWFYIQGCSIQSTTNTPHLEDVVEWEEYTTVASQPGWFITEAQVHAVKCPRKL